MLPVIALLVLALLPMTGLCWGGESPATNGFRVLARVEVSGSLSDIGLPVYADFLDSRGNYYALTIAARGQLQSAGLSFHVIDEYLPGNRYLIARERRPGARSRVAQEARVLHDDGLRMIVRSEPGIADALSEMGFAVKLIGETPIVLVPAAPESPARVPMAFGFTPDPLVSQMIGAVSQDTVLSYISGLTGTNPVTVGGTPYTISTRSTASGEPLQKATQYVFEQLQAMGLTASFQNWTYGSYTQRNVVGELTGVALPAEVVLLTAHLDDMPASGAAPGADDNASGCAALLAAADIMGRYRFQRTIRFVFFTGEEQGLLGSAKYAEAAAAAGDAIVAVLNLDMIAYSLAAPLQRLHTRVSGNPGYAADRALADTFVDVINGYGMAGDLQALITADGEWASDHSSFWDRGFSAILVIEDDDDDFNPYYHSDGDQTQHLNPAYFTAHLKASLGTVAHLAFPLEEAPGTVVIDPDLDTPWTLTGPGVFQSGGRGDATIGHLAAGDYTIAWGEMACYDKPAQESKSLPAGGSIRFLGTYHRTALMGDLNNSGGVSTADAILALKALAGGEIDGVGPGELDSCIDVNGDGRIGSAEAVYILQKTAELR